jgi:ABC-type glycerol-3-phosphate transport system permease component
MWLMRVYFTEVPRELDEAAWIDGCSKMRALWKVVLPTVWPGLTTVGLLVGLASRGEYFGALILTGPRTETAPVAVEGAARLRAWPDLWRGEAVAGLRRRSHRSRGGQGCSGGRIRQSRSVSPGSA